MLSFISAAMAAVLEPLRSRCYLLCSFLKALRQSRVPYWADEDGFSNYVTFTSTQTIGRRTENGDGMMNDGGWNELPKE